MTRVAILISGRGSNMTALLDAMADGRVPATPALVLSSEAGAQGLALAEARGVPTTTAARGAYADRRSFETALHARLEDAGAELVCLAGFMRVLSADLVERWKRRMLNIHPSLLPAFPGLDTHRRALEAGVKLHGCTVHDVTAGVDEGPVLGQAAVPVLPGDDEARLAARVLAAEHRLYPACLAAKITGRAAWAEAGEILVNPKAG